MGKRLPEREVMRLWYLKNPIEVRRLLQGHLDAGGSLDPDDWAMLLDTYRRAGSDRRQDAVLAAAVDLVLGPRGARFVGGLGSVKTSRRASFAVLSSLAALLVKHKRLAEACDVFQAYRDAADEMDPAVLKSYLATAARVKDPERVERAIAAFEKERRGGEDVRALAGQVKKLRRLIDQRPPRDPTPVDKVAGVIAALRAAGGKRKGFDGKTHQRPKPMTGAALRAPDGKPLPPSLKAWLSYDASWLPLFARPRTWKTAALRDLIDSSVDIPRGLAGAAPVIELPPSASQRHFYAFAARSKDGECAVYGQEKNELWTKYPTFADFLTTYFGVDVSGDGGGSRGTRRRARTR